MSWNPHKSSSDLLFSCQRVLNKYPYRITIKQLFYNLVSMGELDGTPASYRKLKNVILNARRKGRMSPSMFVTGPSLNYAATAPGLADFYKENIFNNQKFYVEIWVESDSIKDFIESVVDKLRIPIFVSKGYSDYSFTYLASRRISSALQKGLSPKILIISNFSPQSLSMNKAVIKEMALVFDMTEDEMGAVIFTPFVRLETFIAYSLPYSEASKSSKGYSEFIEQYGEILSSLGYPSAISVDLESIEPFDLAHLIFSVLESILDIEKALDSISVEKRMRSKILDALMFLEEK